MSSKKTVYFLSTLNTNIGDEFIRDGLISVISSFYEPGAWTWEVFNKHQPWTFYSPLHPARLAGIVDRIFHRGWGKGLNILSHLPGNKFFQADLVIQSGTPVIWDGAYRSEWAVPFWKCFAQKNAGKIPLLNLAGGSCYPWSSPPEKLKDPDRAFAKTMVQNADETTVRDPIAQKLLSEASGKNITLLPCSAFLAGQFHADVTEPDGRILLNVMPIGGHFDFLKQIDPNAWLNTVKETIETIPDNYRIEFVCHSDDEVAFAAKHWPHHPIHFPKDPAAYFKLCAGATAGIVNRLHAAVGLSGLGIPCIAVGTDTRMFMTQQLGIPTLFAPEATTVKLQEELTQLLAQREQRSQELQSKREKLFHQYQNLLRPYFEDKGPNTP